VGGTYLGCGLVALRWWDGAIWLAARGGRWGCWCLLSTCPTSFLLSVLSLLTNPFNLPISNP